jgi:hypothetical protein
MADKKISALTAATTPLAGTEVAPIVQSGATVKAAVTSFTNGIAITPASVTVATGNVVLNAGITSDAGILKNTGQGYGVGTDRWIGSDGTTSTWFYNVPTGGNHYFAINQVNKLSVIGDDVKVNLGNLIINTSGKGITNSTGAVKLNFSTAGTALSGAQSVYTGDFFNVGTAQTITITDTNGGYVVITGVQGGVGSSTSTVPFVKRGGSIAVGTASKAILTADPIASITASAGNISVTPLAANTYITYAIYYTPLAL